MAQKASTQSRPRVLVATHLFPTEDRPVQGPWVAEQVDALAATVDMSVFCPSQWARPGHVTRDSGVTVDYVRTATPLGHGRLGLMVSSLVYERELRRFLASRAERFDLLHAHFGFPDAVVVSRVAQRFQLPHVVTLHGDDAFKLLGRNDPVGRTVRSAVRSAAATICVSEAMRSAVRLALPDAAVQIIENGYDATLFGIPERGRREAYLFVGLLMPVKNVDILLRAYARWVGRAASVPPLMIAGDGPLRVALQRLCCELGLDDRVTFLGQQSRKQVADLMRSARCLLLPSASEGYPLVAAEALACGTPVVASRVGGVPEIVTSEDSGILVPAGDEEALADALARAFERHWDAESVAAGSGAKPWSSQAARIADVYRDVLVRSTPPGGAH